MRRFDGLGVLLALAASGCVASTEMDLDAVGTAEGALGLEAASAAPAVPEGAARAAGDGEAARADDGGCTPDTPLSDIPAPIAGPGESCGGFTLGPAPVCGPGLYCSYALEDVCGWADAAGLCRARPASCAAVHAPVCGCDNRTYRNACVAARSGVAVYLEGACESGPM